MADFQYLVIPKCRMLWRHRIKHLLRYDCTNLHEPYDPPTPVFYKFRFPRIPGGNELLLMPDQPYGIHFHRS